MHAGCRLGLPWAREGKWVGRRVGGHHSRAVFPQLYGRLYRVVEPKRIRMNVALAQLQEKQAALAEAQEKLREVSLRPVSSRWTLSLISGMLAAICSPLMVLCPCRWAASGSEGCVPGTGCKGIRATAPTSPFRC